MNIEDYRERQYQDYITTLVDEKEIELIKVGEKYEVYRDNNSPNIILKQIKDLVK